ncbi:MAG: 6-phosphofructokinase [Cytophagales bacterium]|nr:6-phosphofructokinase [Bernardetiaceae bacterium]MDW8204719.1 6-phosphofructokinase [Cytophagales bacterium]
MKNIAVFTSGGDAPGMNACIRAVVRGALHHNVNVFGIYRGYNGMINGDIHPLTSQSVSNIIQRAGTILKSARSAEFRTKEGRKKAYEQLRAHGIEGLVAIGGNGTFTGAQIFYEEYGIPTVGAPGTIDNDLYGTDFTIGFDTAVNTALNAIDKIRDTADSHDRVFFIEVMGRNSGYIALRSAIGGGAEMAIIPEKPNSLDEIIEKLKTGWGRAKRSYIVVVAEGQQPGNATEIAQKVKKEIPDLDVRVSTLGHIQRGGSPSAVDRVIASRIGLAAVEALLSGKSGIMVGIVNGRIKYTPFKETFKQKNEQIAEMIRLVEVLSK